MRGSVDAAATIGSRTSRLAKLAKSRTLIRRLPREISVTNRNLRFLQVVPRPPNARLIKASSADGLTICSSRQRGAAPIPILKLLGLSISGLLQESSPPILHTFNTNMPVLANLANCQIDNDTGQDPPGS